MTAELIGTGLFWLFLIALAYGVRIDVNDDNDRGTR